ncbi:MAG: hypothetical protein M3066_14845 [Actinomycetota bacterium]|nr:hypothetical protein [Actinomycetota bacterium]
MGLPVSFLTHLQTKGYNSRNSAHSRAVCEAIVADLMANCASVRSEALAGQLVFKIDHVLPAAGLDEWKTDLAIGPPLPGFRPSPTHPPGAMPEATPIATRIAVEAKSTMTKHSGARKNRKRDLEAHHQHVHAYHEATIAASVSLINAADVFHSSLLVEPTTITTRAMTAYAKAEGVVNQVKMVAFSPRVGVPGIDAKCALVVEMDNINLASTRYVESHRRLRRRAIRSTGTLSFIVSASATPSGFDSTPHLSGRSMDSRKVGSPPRDQRRCVRGLHRV